MKKDKAVRNLLDMVPERNCAYERREDGTKDVLIPRYGDTFIGRILSGLLKNTPIRIHLDPIGSRTWDLCDGNRRVTDIGEELRREFGPAIDPVFERLALFFKHMERRGLIRWGQDRSSPDVPRKPGRSGSGSS